MWKYAMAQGVSGTPTAFINGVRLDNMPTTVDKWMKYLNYVYNNQYGILIESEIWTEQIESIEYKITTIWQMTMVLF